MGLNRAGFEVWGVDIKPQPRYPFNFVQGDAVELCHADWAKGFDFIWASPPCQAHTSLKSMHNAKKHEDLIPATRAKLKASGVPWVMENVPGSPLKAGLLLCGTMFDLGTADAELRRHRHFETLLRHAADGTAAVSPRPEVSRHWCLRRPRPRPPAQGQHAGLLNRGAARGNGYRLDDRHGTIAGHSSSIFILHRQVLHCAKKIGVNMNDAWEGL